MEHTCTLTEEDMKANGRTIVKMARESKHGLVVTLMTENGRMILVLDMVLMLGPKVTNTLVDGRTVFATTLADMNGLMVANMKESGLKTTVMVKVLILGLMVQLMLALGSITRDTVLAQ